MQEKDENVRGKGKNTKKKDMKGAERNISYRREYKGGRKKRRSMTGKKNDI